MNTETPVSNRTTSTTLQFRNAAVAAFHEAAPDFDFEEADTICGFPSPLTDEADLKKRADQLERDIALVKNLAERKAITASLPQDLSPHGKIPVLLRDFLRTDPKEVGWPIKIAPEGAKIVWATGYLNLVYTQFLTQRGTEEITPAPHFELTEDQVRNWTHFGLQMDDLSHYRAVECRTPRLLKLVRLLLEANLGCTARQSWRGTKLYREIRLRLQNGATPETKLITGRSLKPWESGSEIHLRPAAKDPRVKPAQEELKNLKAELAQLRALIDQETQKGTHFGHQAAQTTEVQTEQARRAYARTKEELEQASIRFWEQAQDSAYKSDLPHHRWPTPPTHYPRRKRSLSRGPVFTWDRSKTAFESAFENHIKARAACNTFNLPVDPNEPVRTPPEPEPEAVPELEITTVEPAPTTPALAPAAHQFSLF